MTNLGMHKKENQQYSYILRIKRFTTIIDIFDFDATV